jgi:Ca-activated chloride channel family protein
MTPWSHFGFQSPWWLLALLAIPLLVGLYWLQQHRRAAYAARFGNPALLPNLVDRSPRWRRHLVVAVLLVALSAMVLGVARPHAKVSVRREEATVMLDVDVSRSMAANDVKPTRLAAAKSAASEFLKNVPDKYRVGLISFGSQAILVVPPTQDRTAVRAGLESLRPGEGTVLGDSIMLALQTAKKQRARDGSPVPTSLLVISDGAAEGGRTQPKAAAAKAKAANVPVSAVVVGTPSGVVTAKLTGGLEQQVRVPPSPQTLQQMADSTGGKLYTATTDKGLRGVYEKLGSRLGHRKQQREITDLFAFGSGALLLLGGGLSALWFRRIP